MLIHDLIKNLGTEQVLTDLIPLIGHFDVDDTYYDFMMKYVSENVSGKTQMIYPVPETGITVVPSFIREITHDAEKNYISISEIHVSYSDDGECYEPIGDTDIPIMRNAFKALASISPKVPDWRVYIDHIYELAEMKYTTPIRDTFSEIYDKLISLNRYISRYDSFSAEKTLINRAFAAVYKFALYELLEYNLVLAERIGFVVTEFSRQPVKVIIDNFVESLSSNISESMPAEEIVDLTINSIAWERVVIWSFTGNLDYPYSDVRIPYVRFLRSSHSAKISKKEYESILAESLTKAREIISGVSDALAFPKMTVRGNLLGEEVASDVNRITAAYISKKLEGLVYPSIKEADIVFNLSEDVLAMLSFEFGSKNFKIVKGDSNTGTKYIYVDPDEKEWLLFTMRPDSVSSNLSAYGWAVSESKMIELIMLSGDPEYDYRYEADM